MHREPETTGPLWVPLQEAAERLSRYLGEYTRFALDDFLPRGRVPLLAMRSDAIAMLPDRVEDLLAKASFIVVIAHINTIRAHYRFSGEQEADRVLGPRSNWRFANPDSRLIPLKGDPDLHWLPLNFEEVRVCWTTLMRELHQAGGGPADETAATLRKLGLWPDSWGPIGSGATSEVLQRAKPQGDTLRPAPAPEIHKAIIEAYDRAEAAGEKPPNVNEVIKPVQARLRGAGLDASGRQIRELAGADQYRNRRRQPGKTVAGEKRQQAR